MRPPAKANRKQRALMRFFGTRGRGEAALSRPVRSRGNRPGSPTGFLGTRHRRAMRSSNTRARGDRAGPRSGISDQAALNDAAPGDFTADPSPVGGGVPHSTSPVGWFAAALGGARALKEGATIGPRFDARRWGRAGLAALLLLASVAEAEGGWLTARGRLQPELRLEAWGGSRTAGVGVVLPDAPSAAAGVSAELAYAFLDRALELRGARVWQFSKNRFGTGSATLGASVHVVPEGFDVGLGPHAGLNLALGGDVFTVDLGLQSGVEIFFRELVPRLPERALLGLNLRLGDWALGLHARAGADIIPGSGFVGRGELAVSLGWFGLERTRPQPAPP